MNQTLADRQKELQQITLGFSKSKQEEAAKWLNNGETPKIKILDNVKVEKVWEMKENELRNQKIDDLEIANEKKNFMEMLNIKETGLNNLIDKGYNLLSLETFFTSGPEESRAWTITKNCTAPKAAGEIHTDFEKGFIRAETISYDDFIKNEGWVKSKENGKMRLEGKDYIVKDGDVLNFRFNT